MAARRPGRRASAILIAACGSAALVTFGSQQIVRGANTGTPQAAAQPSAKRSVLDGVYTDEQAKRGRTRYRSCILCHLDAGQGDPTTQVPALVGEAFVKQWSGHTLKELFEKISTTMPLDNPGELSQQEYVDLVSYILQLNKHPAGKEELRAPSEQLERIVIEKAPGN